MSAAKKIELDMSKLYGFRIVAKAIEGEQTPAALGAKIGGGKGRTASAKIAAKLGAKIGAKIGAKLGFKSRRAVSA